MGNCSFKGETDAEKVYNFIRIMKDSGEILELKGPKLVGDILSAFPGYCIFSRGGQNSSPLFDHERLLDGHSYYLLPSRQGKLIPVTDEDAVRVSPCAAALNLVTGIRNGSGLEVLPSQRNGTWRVKLVINPRKLEEILAEEVNTEALIEQMRIAASSATVKAKQTKRNWGLNWRPSITNACQLPCENNNVIQSQDISTSNAR